MQLEATLNTKRNKCSLIWLYNQYNLSQYVAESTLAKLIQTVDVSGRNLFNVTIFVAGG